MRAAKRLSSPDKELFDKVEKAFKENIDG